MERDKLQAISIGTQAYSMKIELLTNAAVVQKAVDFVSKYRAHNVLFFFYDLSSQAGDIGPCIASREE